MTQLQVSEQDYSRFREYLEKQCGIVLGDNKQYLVQSRMGRVLRDANILQFTDLLNKLDSRSNSDLRQKTIDAMTTNETLWFRDVHPFDYFQNTLLPGLLKDKSRIRIWCAACSSGQEPYSLSMIIEEMVAKGQINSRASIEILATDISSEILSAAKEGYYSRLALGRGLSPKRMDQFFEKKGLDWRLIDKVRNRVKFTQLNLKDMYSGLGKFDIVFCRNVLIYFSAEFKTDILRKIHGQLNSGGALFLGASESLSGLKEHYEMHQYKPGIVYFAR